MNNLRLENRVAIITGSARGIGKAIAIRFADEGAKVVIDDINFDDGEKVVDQIRNDGNDAIFVRADITDQTQVQALVEKTIETYGKIDLLVNNALCATTHVLNNDWDQNLKVVLKGTHFCTSAIIPKMKEIGGGNIINIASVNGLIGLQAIHAYSAAKGGVISLTRSLAIAHGRDNIRVNCICPGTIQTEVWEPMIERNPHIFDDIIPHYPLGRIGKPIDVANAALYLASDESAFVTGSILAVDGGLTAGLPNFPI